MATTATTPPRPYAALASVTDVLRSEFCKLRSVRSTWWTLIFAIASNITLAALAAIFLPAHLSAQQKITLDSIRVSLAGLHLSQIAFGALGVLFITSEYSTCLLYTSDAADDLLCV